MITVSRYTRGIKVDINIRSKICEMVTGDSGSGKSYGSRFIIKSLENEGMPSLYINYENYNARHALLNFGHYRLIIIDQIEQLEDFKLDEYIEHCDHIILIARCYIGLKERNFCRLVIGEDSVRLEER